MHFDYNISFIVLKLIGRKAKPFKYLKGQKTTTTKICKDKLLLSIDKLLLSIDKLLLSIDKLLLSIDKSLLSIDKLLLSIDKLLLSIDKLLLSIDKTSLKRLLEAVNRRKADIMATEKTNKDLQKTNDWAA
jgi:hypothetical protein